MILLILLILLSGVVNGILDNIDHHKGSQGLRDVWHLAKYADRALLIAIGICGYRVDWNIFGVAAVFVALLLAKLIWTMAYENGVKFWQDLDNKVQITTGIGILDDFLGFDK